MGWLDNSGNIILDTTLTDTGRFRLARGEFRIAKFSVFDDEIDYSLYNINHPSGSAYYDLAILQTPILEAFTNNTSYGNNKLISIARTNLLYLPVIKLNDINTPANNKHATIGAYAVAVNKTTEDSFSNIAGVLMGETLNGGATIRVDQGLDTTEISPSFTLDSDLVETQYILEIDNRFGKLIGTDGTPAKVSFIDDDNIASYFLSLGTDPGFVTENTERQDINKRQVISGPRGTSFQFRIQSSIELNTSDFLFSQIGSTTTLNSVSVNYIDTYIVVTGATTGYRISIPVRFIKNV